MLPGQRRRVPSFAGVKYHPHWLARGNGYCPMMSLRPRRFEHGTLPSGRETGTRRTVDRVEKLVGGVSPAPTRFERPRQLVSFGTSGHRGTALEVPLPKRTSWRSRRPSASIARARGSPGRCSWGKTRTPLRRQPTHGSRSAGGQWHRDGHSAERWLYADAGDFPCHPDYNRGRTTVWRMES